MKRWLFVFAGDAVPANLQGVEKRCERAHHFHRGARHVIPTDRHLERAISQALCDEQHFHVEAEALHALAPEDFTRRRPFEQLEATLAISIEWQSA